MADAPKCSTSRCDKDAIMAITNRAPTGKGLITTVYQDEADAPKKAGRYCGEHGVHLAANLAALCDSDLSPVVAFP